MKPTIVFMINSLTGGGAERIMARLIAHSQARARDCDLHLVLLDDEPQAYKLPGWIKLHCLDARGSLLKSVVAGIPLLRRLRPAVCLSFLTRANIVNTLAAKALSYPAIISERVNPSSHHPANLSGATARWLTRALYPRAHAVICPSQGIADDLVAHFGVADARITVIANPVDAVALREASQAPASPPTARAYLVTMGRLVENKNIAMLLRALAASRCLLDLVIVGDGPLRGYLERLATMPGLQARVHFTGFVANPFPLVRNARAYLSSSNAEGFPNSLVEAMALGVPVIATNCRSGPSEILDGRPALEIEGVHRADYGVLIPVDDAGSMAAALDLMMQDEIRSHYAAKAIEGASRYGLAPAVDANWRVLDAAMALRRA